MLSTKQESEAYIRLSLALYESNAVATPILIFPEYEGHDLS